MQPALQVEVCVPSLSGTKTKVLVGEADSSVMTPRLGLIVILTSTRLGSFLLGRSTLLSRYNSARLLAIHEVILACCTPYSPDSYILKTIHKGLTSCPRIVSEVMRYGAAETCR